MYSKYKYRGWRWLGILLLLCMTGIAQAGLGDALKQTLGALGNVTGSTGNTLKSTSGDSATGLASFLAHLRGNYLDATPGTSSFETAVEHQGLGRPVVYIRPENIAPDKAPAVVLLHYRGGTSDRMANLTHAGELAQKYGVWVILPQAVFRRWNEAPFSLRSIDDVGYIDAVIDDAIDNHPIDPKRVYLAGMSNGGFMTNRFACEHSSQIAAAAVVATSLRNQRVRRCQDTAPLPMLIIDGTEDSRVPYDGRLGLLSVPAVFDYWADRDGCDMSQKTTAALPDKADDGTSVTRTDVSGCDNDTGVRLLTVTGGGHEWPGSDVQLTRLGQTSKDIDATDQLWQFFKAFSRP